MNILDENIFADQRELLRKWRVPLRHIGHDIGWEGMSDENIIPLLLQLKQPTLFTSDFDFYKRRLGHRQYCLVYLDIGQDETAFLIRQLLRNKKFSARAQRMGKVLCISPGRISYWEINNKQERHCTWET